MNTTEIAMSCTWKPANCSRGGADSTWSTIRTSNLACPVVHRQQPRSVQLPQHDGCPRTPPCSCCVCAALPPSVHRRASMAPGARAQRRGGARHQTQHPSAASALPPRAQHNASPLTAACMRAAGCLLARLPASCSGSWDGLLCHDAHLH